MTSKEEKGGKRRGRELDSFQKCPSAVMVVADGGGQAGFRVKRCKRGGWDISTEQLTRREAGNRDIGGREKKKDKKKRKKSNAYFGKSLVRLACNQEKKKEKSERRRMKTRKKKKVNQPREETAESTDRRAGQSLSDGTVSYGM